MSKTLIFYSFDIVKLFYLYLFYRAYKNILLFSIYFIFKLMCPKNRNFFLFFYS